MSSAANFSAGWKAPPEDGQILLWPDADSLLSQTQDNHRRLATADSVRIAGIPLPELRRAQRQWIDHDDSRMLIAAGHQIELLHPGVWAKNVLINELAARLGGAAYHLAVDTDTPKHLQLRWPGGSVPLTDDPRFITAQWAALVNAPTPRHLGFIERLIADASSQWPFRPMIGEFLASLRPMLLEPTGLTSLLTNALHQIDWDLGLRHHVLLLSPMWLSRPYLAFTYHLLARAGKFASLYNTILADYRAQHRIHNAGRPWPDLLAGPDTCEVPFWLDHLDDGQRLRASVTHRQTHWQLQIADHPPFILDPAIDGWTAADRLGQFLLASHARLSPRAMTLTAFVRLLLADQFVHGVGGGIYDQITDSVIARFFQLTPPAFSVTTATLFFPTAAGQRPIDLHPLLHEGRRLRHGATLGEQKMRLVRQIHSLPHKSPDRRRLFNQMHARLEAMTLEPPYRDWQQRLDAAQQARHQQEGIFDRELFYLLQPQSRLQTLIGRYHEQFAT
jgi:hypothetical protein